MPPETDWVQQYLQSLAFNPLPQFDHMTLPGQYQFTPEYSASKGWLPEDIGTLQANHNLWEDQNRWMADPIVGAVMGAFDPAAYEPTVETKMPEKPETVKLDMYASGGDPQMTFLISLLDKGMSPKSAVDLMVEEGVIDDPKETLTLDGKPDTSTYDYLVSEGQALQPELYARRQYESAEPITEETPSKAAQKFLDLGLPLPTAEFAPEDFVPEITPLTEESQSRTQDFMSAQKNLDYVRELTKRGPKSTGLKEDERGIMRPTWDGEFNDENRAPSRDEGPQRSQRAGARSSSSRHRGRARHKAMGDDGGASARMNAQRKVSSQAHGNAMAHLAALVAAQRGQQAAQQAKAQNFTPLTAVLMGRAGL